jgi:hypothetical protein
MNTSTKQPSERSEFLDWNLLYLFSFDVELDPSRQERIGRTPSGARMNFFSKRGLSRVYNVGREALLPGDGRSAITGKIEWGLDEVLLREDDIGSCNIQSTIFTDDGATIHVRYRLQGYLGPGGTERIVSARKKDQYGTEDKPFEIAITTSPRFQTDSPAYAWLNDVQAIGFGRAVVVRSFFRRNTQDIYALQ